MKPSVAIAKLTRPRQQNTYRRQRLISAFEASTCRPVLWVSGPPGSGKTTVVSTWLESRPAKGLWYQVDTGDADPARFFYFLRDGAKAAGIRKLTRLPLLTPEYTQDVCGFARRWFRELFAQLPQGATLTLDNYQELPADSALHGALAEASEEIPDGNRLIVLGWMAPPMEYARLAVGQRLVEIGWDALKLADDELPGLGAPWKLAADELRRISAQCDGWIAGFTLLCQRARNHDGVALVDWKFGLQSVFDYFSDQVFRRATPQQREIMIKAAFFSYFTNSMMAEIADRTVARDLYESLSRRHMFVDRHDGPEVIYQYHSLFKTFLRNQASEIYTERGLADLCADLGGILERRGQFDDAIDLYLQAQHWQAASALILKQAPELVATGRGRSFQNWLVVLPDSVVSTTPWLGYWLGMALLGTDQQEARLVFEQAYASFVKQEDARGQILAAGGYVEADMLAWRNLSSGLAWLPIIEQLLAKGVSFPSPEAEARICGVVLDFAGWAAPHHALFGRCAARVLELLYQPLEVNQKLMTASYAIECFGTMGLAVESRQVIAAVADDLKNPKLTVFGRTNWLVRQTYYQGDFGDYTNWKEELLALEHAALENGFAFLLPPIYMRLADICLAHGQEGPALEMNERRHRFIGWIEKPGMVSSTESRVAACRGELGRALECALAAVVDIKKRHFVTIESLYEMQQATIHVLRGELELARQMVQEVLQESRAMLTPSSEIRALANLAWVESLEGNETACIDLLRTALGKARQCEFTVLARMTLLDRWICAKALSHDIETSYVRNIVRNMGLLPELPDIPNWPWPARIFTLGRFDLLLDDQAVEHARKAPQKLLTLLKAIIAGGGKPVSLTRITNDLWPDDDGDSAQQALSVALYRLRKLLGAETSIRVQDGHVSLDENYCWVDAIAYLRLSDRADHAIKAGREAECLDLAERAIRLYGGGFLDSDELAPWSVLLRERLRSRFLRQVVLIGRHLQKTGRLDEALVVYEKGIEAEPLAEESYQGIMQCHLHAGRKAEGLAAFRRLRQVLSVLTGVTPAAASEALHRKLLESGSGENPPRLSGAIS